MSKKGAPRKSFTSYLAEQRARTIDLTDDDGKVLLAVPTPQFWPKAALDAAKAEQAAEAMRQIVGADTFDEFADSIGLDPDVAAANAIAYIVDDLGVATLGESSASSKS